MTPLGAVESSESLAGNLNVANFVAPSSVECSIKSLIGK